MQGFGRQLYIDVTSYHEAGHALAALHEGRRVVRITVSHTQPGNGLCVYARRPQNPFNAANSSGSAYAAWQHTLTRTCADMRVLLAGPMAEAIVLRKPLRSLGARSDFDSCLRMIERLEYFRRFISQYATVPRIDMNEILDLEKAKVRRWLTREKIWKSVASVAEALSYKKELNSVDIDQAINIAKRRLSEDTRALN